VPKPKVNLTRFHGVFAPNSKHRKQITSAKQGKGKKARSLDEDHTPAERRAAMTWAQRLKRVFTKSRRLQAILMLKPAVSAVVMSGLSPVSKFRQ